jgi:hypothetical protein
MYKPTIFNKFNEIKEIGANLMKLDSCLFSDSL